MFNWTIGQPCRMVVKSCDGSPIKSIQQNSFDEIIHLFKSLVTISIEPIQSNTDDVELKDIDNLPPVNSKCLEDSVGSRKQKVGQTAEQRKRKQVISECSDSSSDNTDSDTDASKIRLNDSDDKEKEKSDKHSNHSKETKSNFRHNNKRRKSDAIAPLSDTAKNQVKTVDSGKCSKNEDSVSVVYGSKSSPLKKVLSVEIEKEMIKGNVKTEQERAKTPPKLAPSPSLQKFSTKKDLSKVEVTKFSSSDDICRELDIIEVHPKAVPPKTTAASKSEVQLKTMKSEDNKTSNQEHLSQNSDAIVQGPPSTSVKCEPKNTEEPTTRRETTEKMKKSTKEITIPSNWLDVSKNRIDCVLIVTSMRNGIYQDGRATGFSFKSLYDKFGLYKNGIYGIKHEEGCIKISTNTTLRTKIKNEILKFNRNLRLDFTLIPEVKKPLIKFEWHQEINPQNQFDLIADIKKWNNWKGAVKWVFTKWSSSRGIFQVTLLVTARIRDAIEKENGTILLDNNRVDVIDEFDIVQCFRCAEYGHLATHCNNYRRCGYCGRGHRSTCTVKEPSLWKCILCSVKGHSAFSLLCPVLLDNLRPKLEVTDYRYNYVFLGKGWVVQ